MKPSATMPPAAKPPRKRPHALAKDFALNKMLYAMILPVLVYYFVFHYAPLYGAVIAFKDYSPAQGVWSSDWVGLQHFKDFFGGYYFGRIVTNTVLLSLYTIVFEFPAPIILALLLNELRNRRFKKWVQSITYMPYFISLIVICGIVKDFTNSGGLVNEAVSFFTGDDTAMLQHPEYFRPIYVLSEIWQRIGWESIIYLAALSAVDPEQYDAAKIDGAGRFKQLLHITIPGIMPTIVIMFILRMGNLLNVGFEKIILLYNPAIYETSDVISTYVYRKGLIEFDWSFGAAVGLFNSALNLALLVAANYASRKINNHSLW